MKPTDGTDGTATGQSHRSGGPTDGTDRPLVKGSCPVGPDPSLRHEEKRAESVPSVDAEAVEKLRAQLLRLLKVEFGTNPPATIIRLFRDLVTIAREEVATGATAETFEGLEALAGEYVRNFRRIQLAGGQAA